MPTNPITLSDNPRDYGLPYDSEELMKECRRCHVLKLQTRFHKCSKSPDGLQTWCMSCINKYKRERNTRKRFPSVQVQRDRVALNRKLLTSGLKKCSMCNETKSIDEFWIGEGTGGYRAECIDCRRNIEPAHARVRNYDNVLREHRKARKRMWEYIKCSEIERPSTCPVCGRVPSLKRNNCILFHHTNGYDGDNWCFGAFVCGRCHRKIHDGKLSVEGKSWLQ